jgi:hypothetical protein
MIDDDTTAQTATGPLHPRRDQLPPSRGCPPQSGTANNPAADKAHTRALLPFLGLLPDTHPAVNIFATPIAFSSPPTKPGLLSLAPTPSPMWGAPSWTRCHHCIIHTPPPPRRLPPLPSPPSLTPPLPTASSRSPLLVDCYFYEQAEQG